MALLDTIKGIFRKKKDDELQPTTATPVPAPAPAPMSLPKLNVETTPNTDLLSSIKQGVQQAGTDLSKSWNTFWQPTPDVRVRDVVREVPGAANQILVQPIFRGIESLRQGVGQAIGATSGTTTLADTTQALGGNEKLARTLYGEEDIRSPQQTTQNYAPKLSAFLERRGVNPETAKNISYPTVFLGAVGSSLLDATPGDPTDLLNAGRHGAEKVAVKDGESLAKFLTEALDVPVRDLEKGGEPARLTWDTVKKALSDLGADKKLVKDIESGKVVEGPKFVFQKQGDTLIASIDKSINDVKSVVAPVVEKVKSVRFTPQVKTVDKGAEDVLKTYTDLAKKSKTYEDFVSKAGDRVTTDINAIDALKGKTLEQFYNETKGITQKAQEIIQPIIEQTKETVKPAETFLDQARRVAGESGTAETLARAEERVQPKLDVIEQFKKPLQEQGVLEGLSKKIVDTVTQSKPYRAIADPVGEFVHNTVGKFRFTDQGLDADATAIERAKIGFIEQAKRTYADAKREAEAIVGRTINQEEAGALLRGNYAAEAESVAKGVTNLPLGQDIVTTADKAQEAFKDVHAEIASYVLMHEKELQSLVDQGKISAEQAKKMRLVEPEQFGKNLDNYVRTFYENSVHDFPTTSINPSVVEETRINFSTSKRKLTDEEWGKGYLQALQDGHPEEVTRRLQGPADDLVKRALDGQQDAIIDLGKQVKELRGVVTQGDAVVERTAYNLLNSYRDLKLESMTTDYDTIFSTTLKEGFSPIPNEKGYGPLAGKYVRSDIAKELFSDKNTIAHTTDGLSNLVNAYGAAWKFSKTILNPATWSLNFMTGLTTMQTLAGNSPFIPTNWKYFAKATELFDQLAQDRIVSKELKEFVDLGGRESGFVDIEIMDAAKDIFKDADAAGIGARFMQVLDRFKETPEKLGELYSYLDGYNKYSTFLNKIDHGYTPIEAMKFADKYHLNYAVLPQWVKTLKQSPWGNALVPFISFTAQFPKMVVETAATKPWRFLPLVLAPMAYNVAWKSRNPDLAEQSELQKPEYARNNPFIITLGYDEQKKEFSYFDMGRVYALPGDMSPESLAQFFLGPFSNVGGPLASIADAVRGTDSFGNPLNTPGQQTTTEHVVQGTLPVPNAVFQIADLYKTINGEPARGKLRNPLEEALRIVGITILKGPFNQLQRNVEGVQREYNDWLSYTKKIVADPRSSPEGKQKALDALEQHKKDAAEKIQNYLQTSGNATPDQAAPAAAGIIQGMTPDLSTAPVVDLSTLPMASKATGKRVSAKKATLKLPKAKAITFTTPRASHQSYTPLKIPSPPPTRHVRSHRRAPTLKVPRVPTVSGLRVS